MTTTTKIAILLVSVFALLATLATGWVAASDSPGSNPDRPQTFLTEEGGGVSGLGLPGDVNCDGVVDAIDALWILWFTAGLIEDLPCPDNADVNGDGVINSVDAALILQFITELIGSLSPLGGGLVSPGLPVLVSISSLVMDVGDQADVELEIHDVKDPGLGAWTIDVSYDPTVVNAKSCSAQHGGVCNPAFTENMVRITGASAGGLDGDTILGFITFTCKTSGISPLVISVSVLADATIGDPQDMDFILEHGEITCGGTPTPTDTPTPDGPPTGTSNGRMTGGGRVFTEANGRVTHRFTLHWNVAHLPSGLEVNWEGNRFHLESLGSASCTDDPSIEPHPPTADFDTYAGTGTGRYNGVSGATAEWLLTDAGQPGRKDIVGLRIFDSSNVLVLEVLDNLRVGNHQAHRGQPKDVATDTPTRTPTDGPTPTPTKPSKPTVSIGSLSMELGDAADVDLRALSIPAPGLGAWTIDIVYDSSVVSVLGCVSHFGSVCNPAFNAITIRNAGASAGGIEGNFTLADITFQCKSPGSSALTLTLVIFADATIGDPQPMSANVVNGKVDCGSPVGAADSDGDGCTDLQELGLNEQLGGQRDPNNPWDFYDTNGDGVIDLPNDILGVLFAFGAYDVIYDRGPSAGPDPWNMTAPDGIIDLPNDILGVIMQFGHSCV